MAFGERLKMIREQRGMTQQALADRLHVTRQAVSRWENEARCPDIFTLKQIAEVMGVSIDELVAEDAADGVSVEETVFAAGVSVEETASAAGASVEETAFAAAATAGGMPSAAEDRGEAFVPGETASAPVWRGTGGLLVVLYEAAAFLYFIVSFPAIPGLVSEWLFSNPSEFTLDHFVSAGYLMQFGNALCYVVNFALMLVGACFCAVGRLRPGHVGVIGGAHYAAYVLAWAGTMVFVLEKGAEIGSVANFMPVINFVLFCPLTLWYFCSARRVPFFLILLPFAAVLAQNAAAFWNLLKPALFLGSIWAVLGSCVRTGLQILVQVLILYQGYLLDRMRNVSHAK